MYYLLHETGSTRVASADRLAADPERHGTHAHLAAAQGACPTTMRCWPRRALCSIRCTRTSAATPAAPRLREETLDERRRRGRNLQRTQREALQPLATCAL